MYKNYFYLVRCTFELNQLLKDKVIHDVFSQEKNILFLNISDAENPHQHIIISADQNLSYILVKQNHHKAKKNLIDFYDEYLPSKIISVTIAENDRIIKITTTNFNLYFVVRGNSTNIFLEDNTNRIIPFTKQKLDIANIISTTNFRNKLEFSFRALTKSFKISELSNFYPQIIKEIKIELQNRIDQDNSIAIIVYLNSIVNEIFTTPISVEYFDELTKVVFAPSNFTIFNTANNISTFDTFNETLQKYLILYYSNKKTNELKKAIQKHLDFELSKLSNRLNKLKTRIEQGSKEAEYKLFGNLLQVNRNTIIKGLGSVNVTDYNSGNEITIKVDSKLSANQNIDRYFEKSRDEKINYHKSVELFNFTKTKYDKLLSYNLSLENIDELKGLEDLHSKIIPKKSKIIKMETGLKFKYWHYLIEDKYHVYVGRDSKSNDYLSIKFAKQNDYWFHARGLPGSHVVLRVENTKEGIPKDIIKKAASLSAFYSKAKTAGSASVSYTFAKFVHKKKGMSPGKVLLSKEKTLLVKPGIPKNCELVNE